MRFSTMMSTAGLAAALAAYGCGGDSAPRANDNATGQPAAAGADRAGGASAGSAAASGSAANGSAANANAGSRADAPKQPITLTGCLQKGDGRSDYILTAVNTTRESPTVGTSGASQNGDKVGEEQMRQASHAYRLSGDHDHMEGLVGKQVRVSGTVTAQSDLNEHTQSGQLKERDRQKIDEGDLAKVDVASIDSIADACGGAKSGTKAGARAKKR